MKTIKLRNTVKDIKVLNKSGTLSARIKDAFVWTKERSEETQNPNHNSPADYATSNIQDTAQGTIRKSIYHAPDSLHKVRNHFDRAKKHFREVKRQMPKERKYAAEQAEQDTQTTKTNAEQLRKNGNQAFDRAAESKEAVRDVKQASGVLKPQISPSFTNTRMANTTPVVEKTIITPSVNSPVSRIYSPYYFNKGLDAPKGTDNAVKPIDQSAKTIKPTTKGFKKTSKGAIKTAKKSIKTAGKSVEATVKTAQKTARAAQKTAQATVKATKAAERTARSAAKAAKVTVKTSVAMVKTAIAAIKGLVSLIVAGGGVVVAVILIVCLIGALASSVFGIFFSGEPNPHTGKTVNSVIADIDTDYTSKIDHIIGSNTHNLLDLSGVRAAWKEVLTVYTVKAVTDPDNPLEVTTMDDEKADILQTVFWDMNTISHTIETTTVYEDVLNDNGLPTGETTPVSKNVLCITVDHNTTDEMAVWYGFNEEQKSLLEELLKPEYHSLWNELLYGITSIGDGSLIEIANMQIGNIGGEPYWRWYGFNSRVAWCACFVSWCADQCGYIKAGIIPRFSLCDDGIQWFKSRGQWQNGGYMPASGDIIFFDWEGDSISYHVGIVEYIQGDFIYTIEGNANDSCARKSYMINEIEIMGYGVPEF